MADGDGTTAGLSTPAETGVHWIRLVAEPLPCMETIIVLRLCALTVAGQALIWRTPSPLSSVEARAALHLDDTRLATLAGGPSPLREAIRVRTVPSTSSTSEADIASASNSAGTENTAVARRPSTSMPNVMKRQQPSLQASERWLTRGTSWRNTAVERRFRSTPAQSGDMCAHEGSRR